MYVVKQDQTTHHQQRRDLTTVITFLKMESKEGTGIFLCHFIAWTKDVIFNNYIDIFRHNTVKRDTIAERT